MMTLTLFAAFIIRLFRQFEFIVSETVGMKIKFDFEIGFDLRKKEATKYVCIQVNVINQNFVK
jgi:hypothetical protein